MLFHPCFTRLKGQACAKKLYAHTFTGPKQESVEDSMFWEVDCVVSLGQCGNAEEQRCL